MKHLCLKETQRTMKMSLRGKAEAISKACPEHLRRDEIPPLRFAQGFGSLARNDSRGYFQVRSRKFISRILHCLPFIAISLYLHSYHGEWINNARVEWQYVQNDYGKVYLALDVYAPSGITIDGIFYRGRDVTDSWRLINYPDWYKGKKNFKKLDEFQEELHPYLPYNEDFNVLYTNG